MSITKIRRLSRSIYDDRPLPLSRKDFSGGVNSRQSGTNIKENQGTVLTNVDIGVPSETKKMLGSTLVANDISDNTFAHIHNYERQGYTDVLLAYDNIDLVEWGGSGNFACATSSAFTTGKTDVGMINAKESGLTPDNVVIISNTSDNTKRLHKSSSNTWDIEDLKDDNESIPKTSVMCWYANRIWALKDDLLYFSLAYQTTYASAFNRTTSSFRIPVGAERGLVPIRGLGIVVMGERQIWSISPSITPSPTADQPQPLVTEHGVVSKKGWVNAGDDIYYFAQDGFRSLKRTQQDKLQQGVNFPLSYVLKTQFEAISWANISQLSMVYFDNKIVIAVPTSATTYDTWVYYTAFEAFTVISGLSPRCWAKYKVSGEERLYYAKHGNGAIYRAFNGYTAEGTTASNGTALTYTEEGREEDFGYPLQYKCGGEFEVVAEAVSTGEIELHINLDNAGYQLIGVLSLLNNAITMPFQFPVTFSSTTKVRDKFHLDQYGRFKTLKYKLVHNTANTSEITILERNLVTFLEEYENK